MIVDRYYYNQLNKGEQAIYRAFYKGVMEHQDVIPIPIRGSLSEDKINRIFKAMTRDNPLIYFLNQTACSFAQDMFGHTAICPQYFFSKDVIKQYNRKIEDAVNSLAVSLKLTEGSEYEKERKVHDWMCNFVSYDENGGDAKDIARVIAAHNIIGVFAHHSAQCEGIAKAFKVLLNAVDVRCIVATGNATENGVPGPHAWNIVNIDNTPYQVDVTWDIGAIGKSKDRMAYDYFNITDEMIGIDHVLDDNLPKCDSLELNYFTKNKCYFKTKIQLMAYVTMKLKRGETDLYFRVNPKMNLNGIINDISNMAAKELAEQGQRGIRVQQSVNDGLGICWVSVY